jgi:hypothetical protein
MGWTSSREWTTKGALKESVRREMEGRILSEAVGGGGKEWWLLCNPWSGPGVSTTEERAPVIAVFLLEKARGEWGYKDLSECEHPYYYGCPLRFLDAAPETCKEWRETVRARAANLANRYKNTTPAVVCASPSGLVRKTSLAFDFGGGK